MATLTSSLIVRLLDQVTTPAKKIGASLLGLNNAVGANFGQRLNTAIASNNAALARQRGALFDAAAGFYVLKNALSAPIRDAMAFESAMADVRKVVDFGSEGAFKDFQAELIALSKRIPISVNGLAQIAAAAGQAGIAGEDLIRFTEAAAKVGVAFDISADEAGEAMAKMMTGLGITIDEAVLLTDAMNHLSNAQASSAAEVLDVVRRVGAQAKMFGFTAEEVAALGSAMISAGAQSEVAATSFRNMGAALTSGGSATARQQRAFKKLGLDAKVVAAAMQVDATGTVVDVLERISELPADIQAAVSKDLFGSEARALGPLLTNLNLVKDSLALVSDESAYAGSSFREYEVRAKTFANSVELFNNKLTALKIVIGAALIPAINDLMTAIGPTIEQIADFVSAHPDLTRNVIAATAAVIGFKIAIAGLSFIGLLGKGGALSMLALGYNTLGKAIIGATAAAKGSVGLQATLAAMSGAKFGGFAKFGVALRGIVLAIPGIAPLGGILSAIGAGVATISAPVWGAFAVAAAAVGAAGVLIWKYWDRLSSIFGGVAARIGEELAPAIELARPVLDWLGGAGQIIAANFTAAMDKIGEFTSWIGSFFSQEVLTDEEKAGFRQAGYDVIDSMLAGMKAMFAVALDWFRTWPEKILAAIGNINIASLFNWGGGPSVGVTVGPSELNGVINGQVDTGLPVPSGHRAKGGNVWPGGSFLVGEDQPEIFSPDKSGTITPLSQASGPSIGQIGPFHISGADDPVAVALEVRREVEDALSKMMRGAHADTGVYG
ncbi:phage tail tape measure protein [Devosia ginsengisoli]|uniref:phage tail tape measure protein n=1 Tax=Devosia ginsengisoli TaxID=400770 RepID=UPI0026EDCBB8|nr:phage tail tape measure protein [Devosia ginsengisoli]MCR6673221.1 phage tail tape measure protein [Devosia ginsengisoli]